MPFRARIVHFDTGQQRLTGSCIDARVGSRGSNLRQVNELNFPGFRGYPALAGTAMALALATLSGCGGDKGGAA
ncbi:hypothetical protein QCF01_17355, partial [Staphylococcus aureus]|nr:hypothetical protein [Staphylococcus aureus]